MLPLAPGELEGKQCPRFDFMCGSEDSIGSLTADPRAPEAGRWFDYQVCGLVRIYIFPPFCVLYVGNERQIKELAAADSPPPNNKFSLFLPTKAPFFPNNFPLFLITWQRTTDQGAGGQRQAGLGPPHDTQTRTQGKLPARPSPSLFFHLFCMTLVGLVSLCEGRGKEEEGMEWGGVRACVSV